MTPTFNKPVVVLETERLVLRQLTMDDIDNLQKIFSDPIAMQYYPKTFDIEETRGWIQRVLFSYDKHDYGLWACQLKDTGEFVGQCGLLYQNDIDGQDEIEVGYLLVRKFWHQGLATEAARAVMDYARHRFGFERLISLIRPENLPSRRVAERNGLVVEKTVERKGFKHLVYVSNNKS